ncbi:uncharacterized protein FFNC_15532 [Fusarium fujikuroi]|nr:uncharacterized protein FFC1_15623 [Fusarium fujikuroi]SCO26859.1 uncharacterized protein FFM5_15128 [Fusarium fujikuroi]SCO54477.1 uncharacterized protein FFNC_15532 [Fusarium fujikuroi]
MYIKIK